MKRGRYSELIGAWFTFTTVGLVALTVLIFTGFIVPLLKAKIGAEKCAKIAGWVRIAIQDVEQIFKEAGKWKEKSAYVKIFFAQISIRLTPELRQYIFQVFRHRQPDNCGILQN